MDLESVIRKYDYVNSTEETESAIQDDLVDNRREFEDNGNSDNLRRCVAALQEKVCVKGFPIRMSRGYFMASRSIHTIRGVMAECVDEGRATKEECHQLLLEFLLACLRTGPGSAHTEIIGDVIKYLDLYEYLEEMRGEALTRVISTLKELTHTSEEPDMPLKDQCSFWDHIISRFLKAIIGDSDQKKMLDQSIHEQFLDLHMFYFLKMGEMPGEYSTALGSVMSTIEYGFKESYDNRNPYKNLKNMGLLQKHMVTLQGKICNDKFGTNKEQVKRAKDTIDQIFSAIRGSPSVLEVWDAVLDFMKALSVCKTCVEFPELMEPFRFLFDKIPKDFYQKHPEIVDKWAPVFSEVLLKAPSIKVLKPWAYNVAGTVGDRCTLKKKSAAAAWFPIVKGLLKCGEKESGKAAYRILYEGKFKKIWTWKENVKEGKEMVEIIGKVDFPTSGDRDETDLLEAYGDCVKTLIEQFKIAKIMGQLAADVAELAITMMEKRSGFLNEFTERFVSEISLENNQDIIPNLLRRFAVLFTDPDYPWDDTDSMRCGGTVITKSIEAYSSGKDMPTEVNESLLKIFLYAMETDDLEYRDMEHGITTIYGNTAGYYTIQFVGKHISCESSKDTVLAPLMRPFIKLLDHDEEVLQEAAHNVMQMISPLAPSVLVPYISSVIEWYANTQDMQALSAFWKPYQVSKGITEEEFSNMFQAMADDTAVSAAAMQSVILMDMAEKQPQMFTQEHVDLMIERFVYDANCQYRVLVAFGHVIKKKPELFGDNMIKHVLRNPDLNMTYTMAIQTVGLNLAMHKEELVDTILKEFINLLKKCTDTTYQVALIDGVRSLGTQHGKEILFPYRAYFEDIQKNGANMGIKDMATSVINTMDGITVEGIVEDVKQQKEDIDVLNVKVSETGASVVVMKGRIDQQDEEIGSVKTGLVTVNERVDVVEEDLGETKIKVEEVDKKTMSNAPAWSRDLTKLMNPKAKHDWTLLAQRLGYTPKDIKGWATQNDPCMALLSEWYATHKTIEATHAVLTALQEMDRLDAAVIVENAMKAVEDIVEEAPEYSKPPPIFLSYQWGHQNEVKLLRQHFQMAGYECWMDIGQMGGGDKLFEKIDSGIRGSKIIICCVSEKYAKSPNCNREVNLAVNLGKPMIPLLMEKMSWPPKGSMGPIFSEYLFVRFFQRGGEETADQRFWPVAKFQEVLMQLNMYKAMPDESMITQEYKDWWIPMAEEIIIQKKPKDGGQSSQSQSDTAKEPASPDVFLSYQWGKQTQIKTLYRRLTELGYSCWMDIYQMGGGDSLYDKIDSGVRGCKVVLSCVTTKYAFSANCRREVSLADSLKKPLVPLLLEKMDWPPSGPMSLVFTQLLFINFYRDENIQTTWTGDKFDELLSKVRENIPEMAVEDSKDVEREVKSPGEPSKTVAVVKTPEKKAEKKVEKEPSKAGSQNGIKHEEKKTRQMENTAMNGKKESALRSETNAEKSPVKHKDVPAPTAKAEVKSPVKSSESSTAEVQKGGLVNEGKVEETLKQSSPKIETTQPEPKKKSSACVLL